MQNIIKLTVGHSWHYLWQQKYPPLLNTFKYNTEDYTFNNNTSYKYKMRKVVISLEKQQMFKYFLLGSIHTTPFRIILYF